MKLKKLLGFVLAFAMVLSLMPAAFAAGAATHAPNGHSFTVNGDSATCACGATAVVLKPNDVTKGSHIENAIKNNAVDGKVIILLTEGTYTINESVEIGEMGSTGTGVMKDVAIIGQGNVTIQFTADGYQAFKIWDHTSPEVSLHVALVNLDIQHTATTSNWKNLALYVKYNTTVDLYGCTLYSVGSDAIQIDNCNTFKDGKHYNGVSCTVNCYGSTVNKPISINALPRTNNTVEYVTYSAFNYDSASTINGAINIQDGTLAADTITVNGEVKNLAPAAVTTGDGVTTPYPTFEAALAAATSGDTITLRTNVVTSAAAEITKDITVDLNGCEIKTTGTDGNGVFWVKTGGKLTLEDSSREKTGVVNGVGGDTTYGYHMAIWADGGDVVINGGTYTNEGASGGTVTNQYDLIYVKNNGSVTINGGTFKCATPRWTLNVNNVTGGTITVKGGSFWAFDPAGAATDDTIPEGGSNPVNYVAEGYEVKESAGYYHVSKEAPAGPALYTITKAACENGKVTAQAIMASQGSNIKVSAVPAEGYKVASLIVTDAAGNEIEVVDGKIKMPASNVTVSATFIPAFEDIDPDNEHLAAISYMYDNGLMIGTSTEEMVFSGDVKMTRSQIAMILFRLAGEPETAYAGTFTDAPEGAWYTEAAEWANTKGIMVGVGDGTFAHGRQITVVEMAALIYRYAQCEQNGACTSSDWATESAAAMTWCVENGILAEDVASTDIASRYLAAEMFYAVYNLLNK